MNYLKSIIFTGVLICLSAFPNFIFAQSGGSFEIEQSVIAGGGGSVVGGVFSLDGTIGQTLAGVNSNGSPFAVTSGFWNFTPLAPTAASVSVSGRIVNLNGSGIRNVRVMLTAPDGQTRTAQTGTFGAYRFEGVPVGATYIISIFSKRFTFSQSTQVVSVSEAVTDINFIANEV